MDNSVCKSCKTDSNPVKIRLSNRLSIFYTFVKSLIKQWVISKIGVRKKSESVIPRPIWRSAVLCVSQVKMAEKFQKNGKIFSKTVLTPKSHHLHNQSMMELQSKRWINSVNIFSNRAILAKNYCWKFWAIDSDLCVITVILWLLLYRLLQGASRSYDTLFISLKTKVI